MKKTGIFFAVLGFLLSFAGGWLYGSIHAAEQEAQRDVLVLEERNTVTEATELEYRYFYTKDGVTKTKVEQPPEFLLGLSKEQLESVCEDWQVLSFSPERIVLRQKIEGRSDENYVIGENGGYLAVYYEDMENELHLKETTNRPVSSLPKEDEKAIRKGVRVQGEGELARLLADLLS